MTRAVVTRETGNRPVDDRVPDALVGAATLMVGQVVGAGRLIGRVAGPGARFVLEPPLIPWGRRPARLVEALAVRGRTQRDAAGRALDHAVAALVPALIGHLARLVPLTELIQQSVDLDVLVADVDLDAVAIRIDLDAVAARIDVDAILDRVDLNNVAKERLDLNALVRTVDMDAIIGRLDLVALANEVIAAIDLPEIIRQSSGSLASETVRNVRTQSIEADRAVERAIDRFRRHRRLRSDGPQPGGATT
jgi:hypothetical protein